MGFVNDFNVRKTNVLKAELIDMQNRDALHHMQFF